MNLWKCSVAVLEKTLVALVGGLQECNYSKPKSSNNKLGTTPLTMKY